jgi:WD40 repeat protein
MIIRREHRDAVYAIDYSPDGRLLATGGADGFAVVWRLPDLQPILRLGPHDAEVWRVLFLRDRPRLICGTFGGQLFYWGLDGDSTMPLDRARTGNGQVRTLVAQPSADRFFVGAWDSRGSGESAWWRFEGRLRSKQVPLAGFPRPLVRGPWTPEMGEPEGGARSWHAPPRLMDVAIGGDGRAAAVEEGWDAALFVFDAKGGQVRAAVSLGKQGRAVAFVGGSLAVAVEEEVRIFDAATLDAGPILRGHEDWVLRLAATPDGRGLLSASRDGSVRLWDARSWAEAAGWQWRLGTLWSLAVAADGMTAAAGGGSGEIVVWDLQ